MKIELEFINRRKKVTKTSLSTVKETLSLLDNWLRGLSSDEEIRIKRLFK